jgi:hypothetical protein
MTLKDFVLTDNNHFIACQQYKLFFKRIYLVLITKNYLIGLVCNNNLSVESDADILINHETNSLRANRGSFLNPYSYLKAKIVKKVANKYLFDRSIYAIDKANFRIDRNDVKTVTHTNNKAAYLGNYPTDGTIYIETLKGMKQQFEILGEQKGKDIVQYILTRQQVSIVK